MDYYNKDDINEIISELEVMYTKTADDFIAELEFLVGDVTPYSEGDELTEDHKDLIDSACNYIDNNGYNY